MHDVAMFWAPVYVPATQARHSAGVGCRYCPAGQLKQPVKERAKPPGTLTTPANCPGGQHSVAPGSGLHAPPKHAAALNSYV